MSSETGIYLWVVVTMVLAFALGILFLLGKGDKLISDNKNNRNGYDMKKAQKGFGVAFLVMGAGAAISLVLDTTTGYMIYITLVVAALIGSALYMQKCCKY